jgi:aquaporin Z
MFMKKELMQYIAEAIGTFILVFAGPVSGASMNPARSIAPAIVSGHLEHIWIYMLAPIAGAVFGCLGYRVVNTT